MIFVFIYYLPLSIVFFIKCVGPYEDITSEKCFNKINKRLMNQIKKDQKNTATLDVPIDKRLGQISESARIENAEN